MPCPTQPAPMNTAEPSNVVSSDKTAGPALPHTNRRGTSTRVGVHVPPPSSNVHPMETRSKLGVFKPKTYASVVADLVADTSADLVNHEPTLVAQALASPQ